jgi:protein-S-isoprenylcysteine O-methyltransferase Ste14
MTELLAIAAAWLAYGLIHSFLASTGTKAWVARHLPEWLPAYRLLYNVLAVVLLLPPLWLTYHHPGEALWSWPVWISWPAALLAVAGFLWTLRWYDMKAFLGLKQWRCRDAAEREGFILSPLHRYVRHPWYSLGLLFIWTRDLNAAWLTTAAVVTLYLALGSRLEEDKLIALYGDAYRRYRARVPGLIPMPGRHLGRDEALALQREARIQP